MRGYIKLYRKTMNSPIWQDPYYLKLWLYCLMKAAHKEHEQLVGNQLIKLLPGEFVTGRKALAKDLNSGMKASHQQSDVSWWRYLNNLEKFQMLNIKKTNKFSVISILKWNEYQETEQQVYNKYQGFSPKNEKQEKNSPKTEHQKEQANPFVSTDTEIASFETEQQVYNNCTSSEQQVYTNKNVKNDKNEKKKDYTSKIKDLLSRYVSISNFNKLNKDYWDVIRETRITGKVSPSVIYKSMKKWEKYDTLVVQYALKTHVEAHAGKKEEYTIGIMRGTTKEDAQDRLDRKAEKVNRQQPIQQQALDPREIEIAASRWEADGNKIEDFDWTTGKGIERKE